LARVISDSCHVILPEISENQTSTTGLSSTQKPTIAERHYDGYLIEASLENKQPSVPITRLQCQRLICGN